MWPNNNGSLAPRLTFDAYARAMSVHYFHGHLAESREAFIEMLIREYCQFLINFASKSSGKKIIVDKITPYPGTTRHVVGQLSKFFPNSKIIKLIRDGRDVVTSGTFDWLLKDGQGTERFKCFVKNDPAVVVEHFFDDHSIQKWATNWRETIGGVNDFDLEIRYEEMLRGLPQVLTNVFDHLGVESGTETSQRCAEEVTFEKMTGRRNGEMDATAKQRSGTCGDWKKFFTRRDGEQFHSIAGKELISLGYESQQDWFTDLPEELAIRWDGQPRGVSPS